MPTMTFRVKSFVMTIAGCLLGLRFLFAGSSVLAEWGVEATAGALVVARRLGAIYLAVAAVFFVGRSASPSDIRSALCLVAAAVIAVLACLGLFELWAGRVGSGVLRSVVAEAVLAAAFVWVWWGGR